MHNCSGLTVQSNYPALGIFANVNIYYSYSFLSYNEIQKSILQKLFFHIGIPENIVKVTLYSRNDS